MTSFRLRLDISLGPSPRRYKPPPFAAAAASATINGGGCQCMHTGLKTVFAEFDISYDDRTTVADILRDIVETHFLGGHLLRFLECISPIDDNSSVRRREQTYVLLYSEDDATLVQPYWSSRCGDSASGGTAQKIVRQMMLQLSLVGSDTATEGDEAILPGLLVSSLVQKSSPRDIDRDAEGQSSPEKTRKLYHSSDFDCLDVKLGTKDVGSDQCYEPNKVNVLLCEEHWRERGKLLEWNLHCASKASSSSSDTTSDTPGDLKKGSEEQNHSALKSLLVYNFLGGNTLLLAKAFLIPTSLVFRGLDTIDGIQLSVDKPGFCQSRTINVERRAVLRQYFGIDLDTTSNDLRAVERGDVVWRTCYGVGSGSISVGIHQRFSTTREMTTLMNEMADEIYEYIKRRYENDSAVTIHPFNHATVMFYYQKKTELTRGDRLTQPMLGYHTDNVFSHDGSFLHDSNSQIENTFTALLTLGDERELHFRRQETQGDGKKKKWVSDDGTLPFSIKHGSLFLLHPADERPTRTSPDGPMQRYQHGDVKFPYPHKLSAVLAFRAVTTRERVYKDTGKLFKEQPSLPQMLPMPPSTDGVSVYGDTMVKREKEPELDFLLGNFHQKNFATADERLKHLWLSLCYRHFRYKINQQPM